MNPTHTGANSIHLLNILICLLLISKNGLYIDRVQYAMGGFGSVSNYLPKNICMVKISLCVIALTLSR